MCECECVCGREGKIERERGRKRDIEIDDLVVSFVKPCSERLILEDLKKFRDTIQTPSSLSYWAHGGGS